MTEKSDLFSFNFLGYKWEEISSCVEWMAPFAFALRGSNNPASRVKTFTGVSSDDQHNIQAHSVELSMLECAQQRQALIAAEAERSRQSPDPQQTNQDYQMGYLEMTPPDDLGRNTIPTTSNIQLGAQNLYYDSGSQVEFGSSPGDANLDERRRDAMITMPASPSNTKLSAVKMMQRPHQQSSVFLSPASDDSGLW